MTLEDVFHYLNHDHYNLVQMHPMMHNMATVDKPLPERIFTPKPPSNLTESELLDELNSNINIELTMVDPEKK